MIINRQNETEMKMIRFAVALALVVVGCLFALDPLDSIEWGWQVLAGFASYGGWLLIEHWERLGKI